MRILLAAAGLVAGSALAGCAFEPGDYIEGDDPRGEGGGTGSGGTGGTGSGTGTTPRRTCEFDDLSLRLCLDFEDAVFDPMVTDASATKLDSPTVDVASVNRSTSSGPKVAAGFLFGSRVSVPEALALDIAGPITIEMWVHPISFGASANLLHNAGQYELHLEDDLELVCSLGGSTVSSVFDVDLAAWDHVACVYDGQNLRLFIDGDLAGSVQSTSAPATAGGTGTLIGGTLAAGVDDIRIYARALAASDICTHAGRTSCSTSLGGDDGDGGNRGPGGGDGP